MKLHMASRCALYAMLELAKDPERQVSAADIAKQYGISLNHLAKVMRDLSRAGLVEAVRGVGGGYRLRANAKRTTLLDVIGCSKMSGTAAGRSPARRRRWGKPWARCCVRSTT